MNEESRGGRTRPSQGGESGSSRAVAEDLQRIMPGPTLVTCSGFGEAVIRYMDLPAQEADEQLIASLKP